MCPIAERSATAIGPACAVDAVLEAHDVTKRYLLDDIEVSALRGVDLEVCRGEMLAIMGPSGSGKSTLMHIVGLLDHPTTGTVTIDGEDVSHMDPNQLAAVRNKRIGFVFQSFNLLARTTAQANVELPLIYAGLSGAERSKRAPRGARARRAGQPAGPHAQPAVRRAAAARRHRARAR